MERIHVKLTAGIAHAGRVQRVCLQLGIMRRGNARSTRLPHRFNDSHRQCRPLNRIGTSAQLVKQHQRTRSDLMHNGHDVDHV